MEEFEKNTPQAEIPADATFTVVDIRFRSGGKTYFFDPGALELATGDEVIIDTARGPEFGTCASGIHTVSGKDIVAPLRSVIRKATAADQRIAAENREKEKRAFSICQQKITEHKLDMQLVSAECAFDGSKILFFFTADGRVDFRDLVKNLASVFRTRIELRQTLLLQPVPRRLPAGLDQDGQDPEPQPEPHQNFRHLRQTDVLPQI